jgi:SAM-dependent methyltransferase
MARLICHLVWPYTIAGIDEVDTMTRADPADPVARNAAQYARREAAVDAHRYSLFDVTALQEHQERCRAMLALWRRQGWQTLAGRRIVEVGCGGGGNLLDLLRFGAAAGALTGIELLPERVAAARRCLPVEVNLIEGDAAAVCVPESSQDAVLAFTVFSSVLEEAQQDRLAAAMWRWVKPGGGVLWYDFVMDNPRNPDVRGVPVRRVRTLFPAARLRVRNVTLAPPLARAVARLHPSLLAPAAVCLPFLKTHRLIWALKP